MISLIIDFKISLIIDLKTEHSRYENNDLIFFYKLEKIINIFL
jgi:hypothetical protein